VSVALSPEAVITIARVLEYEHSGVPGTESVVVPSHVPSKSAFKPSPHAASPMAAVNTQATGRI
jgi:hypothetical protein